MPNVNMAADDDLITHIDERTRPHYHGGRGWVARRDLQRYYAILARELRTLLFSEAELLLLLDATNGVLHDAWSIPLLAAGVEDAMQLQRLDAKWDVNAEMLLAKLNALTPGQAFALIDALERAWQGGGDEIREHLARVGLLDGDGTGHGLVTD